MGFNGKGNGVILADDMGLGKTIQTISLLWTLLKQSPNPEQFSVIKRALIVCPASLIQNWKNEFNKWIGEIRLKIYVVDSNSTSINDFILGRVFSVMVIGYEKVKTMIKSILKANFDIVVCDEGHRLKNRTSGINMALSSIPTKRRLLLSGTPIQNDLAEFYSMVEWVNPGSLGSFADFNRQFIQPIQDFNELQATEQLQKLTNITSGFILRRTSEINIQYLPEKLELIIFIRMTKNQASKYQQTIDEIDPQSPNIFFHINSLRKIANFPGDQADIHHNSCNNHHFNSS